MARFSSFVDKSDGCWTWTGAILKKMGGYGAFRLQGRTLGAHRASWVLMNGPIPAGLFVCHHCDNPACVRPDHLFLGTNADNVADMVAKGRQRDPIGMKGSAHPRAKVSERDVLEIRRRAMGGDPRSALASEFGISASSLEHIISRRTWRHVA